MKYNKEFSMLNYLIDIGHPTSGILLWPLSQVIRQTAKIEWGPPYK